MKKNVCSSQETPGVCDTLAYLNDRMKTIALCTIETETRNKSSYQETPAKLQNEVPILNRMEVDKSSEHSSFISRNARKRARRRAKKANDAYTPELIQEGAENLVAPVKEHDKDSGKESVDNFSEFVNRSGSPTVVLEEGEQNLSPTIIEPPQDRITSYYDNIREWRERDIWQPK